MPNSGTEQIKKKLTRSKKSTMSSTDSRIESKKDSTMKSFIIETIMDAGELLLQNFGKQHELEYKEEGKYRNYPQAVTKIDKLVEEYIVDKIRDKFSGHHIFTEETPEKFVSDGYTWIIDPIDGTTHFSRGIPLFSISIAVQYNKEVICGAVYAPYLKNLYFAEKGNGAECDGKRICVSKIGSLHQALVITSVYQSYKINNLEKQFNSIINSIKNIRMFASSALDMCYVASGKAEARIFSNTEIWDHAAAALVVEEAGGKVTDWQGKKWTYETESLLVSNNIIHNDVLKLLV